MKMMNSSSSSDRGSLQQQQQRGNNNDNHDDDVNDDSDCECNWDEASGKEFKAPRVQITTKTILVLLMCWAACAAVASATRCCTVQKWQQIARIKYVESMRHKG